MQDVPRPQRTAASAPRRAGTAYTSEADAKRIAAAASNETTIATVVADGGRFFVERSARPEKPAGKAAPSKPATKAPATKPAASVGKPADKEED